MRNIKSFEDFLDRMQGLLDNAKEQGHLIVRVEDLENTFPELKESEDERIRKELISFLRLPHTQFVGKRNQEKWIAWLEKQKIIDVQSLRSGLLRDMAMSLVIFLDENTLGMDMSSMECEDIESAVINSDWLKIYTYMKKKLEKQGEQKPTDKAEPKFKVGDWIVNNISKDVFLIKSINNGYCTLEDINGIIYSPCLPPIEDDNHLWTIEDARDGDVLFMDNGSANCIFIYKSSNNGIINKYASYNNFGFEGEHYIILNDGYVIPATKEQRDLLFKKMKDASYEWDAEKKKLKKIEQKPVNSYCQENCKGFQETEKCFADWDCKDKREAESIDEVKPKFHKGEWITNGDYTCKIIEVKPLDYILQSQDGNIVDVTISHVDEQFHSFTIKDAKPGDVIYLPNGNNEYYFFIFKGIENATVMSFDSFYQYDDGTSKVEGTIDNLCSVNDVFQPATKEQRDILFQKMKEAGYEWDAEKKELRKIENEIEIHFGAKDSDLQEATYYIPKGFHAEIEGNNVIIKKGEQKPAWSEEDEYLLNETIQHLEELIRIDKVKHCACDVQYYQRDIDWLKAIKLRMNND